MKKINNNNKFRGNAIYSLNYKFDSVSSAGKFSGTALELIKKYNELAKEAQSNGNYVEMEVFRQYAEHYRKIVTEINERKNQSRDNQTENTEDKNTTQAPSEDNGLVETESASQTVNTDENETKEVSSQTAAPEKKLNRRRNFTIISVSENSSDNQETESPVATEKKHRRVLTRKSRGAVAQENQAKESD